MRHFYARADPETHATRPCAREYRHRALHSQAPTASSPPHSQAPIALHASTPQAHTTFRSCAPRSLMTLRASAPWTSMAFHVPRSAPQAPPHSSQACTSSIRCRTSAHQTRGASRHSSGRPSTGALFTLAYSASPAFASTSVTSVMVKSGTARRGSSLASWSSSANEQQGAPGQLKSGSSLRRS